MKKQAFGYFVALVVFVALVFGIAIIFRAQKQRGALNDNNDTYQLDTSVDQSKPAEENIDQTIDDVEKALEDLDSNTDFSEIEEF